MNDLGYRRGGVEIRRDILNVCLIPRKITEILRFANIQYNAIEKHLDPLIEINLIKKSNHQDNKEKYIYKTTTEGKQVLQEIEELAPKLNLDWRKRLVYIS